MKHFLPALLPALACVSGAVAQPRYLFVDDTWIASSYEVTRVVPEPVRHELNPLVVADRPWESGVNTYGTVLYDQGRFRMWYQIYHAGAADPRYRTAVGYAESGDGIRWTKPALDRIEYGGEETNLVLLSHGTSSLYSPAVIRDDEDPDASRRYKMLYWDSMSEEAIETVGTNFPIGTDVPGWRAIPGEGFFAAYSPDGIRWTNASPQPVFTCACDASSLTQTPDGAYEAVFKISVRDDRHFRVLGRASSRDFEHWTTPEVILEPDWKDPYGTEFYGMSALPYFGNDLGLVWVYYNAPSDKHVDIQLARRSNGAWHRAADRRVFLPVGPLGAWDAGGVYAASDVIVSPPGHEDEIFLYYGGTTVRHDDARYREVAIGLARFRLDGFAAMHAGPFQGSFETTPIVATGPGLVLNVSAHHGEVAVEALDAATGSLRARSEPIAGLDDTAVPVRWETGGLPPMEQVVLRFRMQRADLYSFRFAQ